MRKWKVRTKTINIDSIKLDNMTLNEGYLEVSIDICDMSEELKAEVNKAIEIEKMRCTREWDEILSECDESKRFSTKWSDKPAVIERSYLLVILVAGKPNKYTINTDFHDADNNRLAPTASINVDLPEYEDELKKAIIHVLIDRFF